MPETTAETTPTNAVTLLHERDESIEHILESAVVANWTDVMRGVGAG
jgi:hypothetical protein